MQKESEYYRGRACCYSFSISMPLLFTYICYQIISLLLYTNYDPLSRSTFDLYIFLVPIFEAVGTLLSIRLIKYGRRRTTMLMCAFISFLSFLGFLPFENLAYHIAIKLLLCLPIGFFGVQVLYFVYEIAPPNERGWMIGITNFTFSLGNLYSNALQYLAIQDRDWFVINKENIVSLKDHQLGTKTLISFTVYYIPILLPWLIIFIFSCVYQRQTPAFLLQNQRFGEVKPALSQIYRNASIQSKINDIISEESFDGHRRKKRCMNTGKLKAFFVCLVIAGLGQLSGNHAIQVNLAQQNSPNKLNMSTFSVLSIGIELLGTLAFILFMSRIARKILLVGGLLLLSSCEASLICFTLNPGQNTAIFTVFVSSVFIFIFGMTVRNIAYIIIVEMLEFKLGAITIALTYAFSLLSLLIQYATRTVYNLQNISNLTILYCVFNLVGVVLVMALMNESNQKRRDQVVGSGSIRDSRDSEMEQLKPGLPHLAN